MSGLSRAELEDVTGLLAATHRRFGPAAAATVEAAYALAEEIHRGELRKSGDPYVTHCVAVARLVLDWGQDVDVIRAALLHDAASSDTLRAQVRGVAGRDGVDLIDAALARDSLDPKAAALGIADRLHNARTWRWVPPRIRARKAAETLATVVPLATALGLHAVAAELQGRSVSALGRRTAWAAAGLFQLSSMGVALDATRTDRVAAGLYRAAVRLARPADRRRYAEEWAGDLAVQTTSAERAWLALGAAVAAARMRCR